MSKNTAVLKKNMIQALEKSLGIVTTAVKSVGIDRSTHYDWLDNDEKYKKAVQSIQEIALDFVESKLHQRISDGSDTCTIFYLRTKGKSRGYVDKAEPGANGDQVIIKVIRE